MFLVIQLAVERPLQYLLKHKIKQTFAITVDLHSKHWFVRPPEFHCRTQLTGTYVITKPEMEHASKSFLTNSTQLLVAQTYIRAPVY